MPKKYKNSKSNIKSVRQELADLKSKYPNTINNDDVMDLKKQGREDVIIGHYASFIGGVIESNNPKDEDERRFYYGLCLTSMLELVRNWKPECGSFYNYVSNFLAKRVSSALKSANRGSGDSDASGVYLKAASLDYELDEDGKTLADTKASDTKSPLEACKDTFKNEAVKMAIATLSVKEQKVITDFMNDVKPGKTASDLNLTTERVRQIREAAFAKLAESLADYREIA